MSAQEIGLKVVEVFVSIFRVIYWYLEALFRQFVPPAMKSIDGEVVLVTGAAGGIGKEICKTVAKSGSNIKLVIWDINQGALDQLAGELEKIGGKSGLTVHPFAVDISSRENIEAGCQQIKDTVGPATVIFNNAGIAPQGTFLQLSNEQIEGTFNINLMSHIWIIRQFLPEMVALNHGRIVNVCSMGGLKASTHALPYYSSKFAVNGYTEALKAELALPNYNFDGIHLTTVYPYFVQTPLIKSLALNKDSNTSLPGPFRKFLTPEEVGRKTVEGMRREYEYVYLPSSIPLVIFFDALIPMKLRKHMESKHYTSFLFKDEAEQEKFMKSPYYMMPAPSTNGKPKKTE